MSRFFRIGRAFTGLGLFATRPIKRGAYIATYRGPILTAKEADRREARGARYMFELDSRWTVDGSVRSNIARYANHSCRPNAESDIVKGKVILRAIRNIAPGDEITYDYGEEYFELFLAGRCRCEKCMEDRRKARTRRRNVAKRRSLS